MLGKLHYLLYYYYYYLCNTYIIIVLMYNTTISFYTTSITQARSLVTLGFLTAIVSYLAVQ